MWKISFYPFVTVWDNINKYTETNPGSTSGRAPARTTDLGYSTLCIIIRSFFLLSACVECHLTSCIIIRQQSTSWISIRHHLISWRIIWTRRASVNILVCHCAPLNIVGLHWSNDRTLMKHYDHERFSKRPRTLYPTDDLSTINKKIVSWRDNLKGKQFPTKIIPKRGYLWDNDFRNKDLHESM